MLGMANSQVWLYANMISCTWPGVSEGLAPPDVRWIVQLLITLWMGDRGVNVEIAVSVSIDVHQDCFSQLLNEPSLKV